MLGKNGELGQKTDQSFLPRPVRGLIEVCEQFDNTLIQQPSLPGHHRVLEPLTNWPTFQDKPDLRQQLVGEEWQDEAETRPDIVVQVC